jgi:hypothetical protein
MLDNTYGGPRVNVTDGSTTVDFTVNRGKNGERRFRSSIYQTQEGSPTTPFSLVFPFGSAGFGASNVFIPEMHNYSTADARTFGELWPRPYRTDFNLSTLFSMDGQPRAIWTGLDGGTSGYGHIYVGGGTKVGKINRQTGASEGVKTFTGSVVTSQPVYVNGTWLVPMSSVDVYQRLTVVGVGNISGDTWADGPASEGAMSFGYGFTGSYLSVIRGNTDGTISLAAEAADWSSGASWATDYQIEKFNFPVWTVLSLGKLIYVCGPNGCWSTNEFGSGVNLTPDIAPAFNISNGRNAVVYHGGIMYPHRTGLYRVEGTSYQPVGIEEIPTADGTVKGIVTAQAALGHWLYFSLFDGADSWICCLRERRQDEAGFGPYVIYTLENITACWVTQMHIDGGIDGSGVADGHLPRLWFAWDSVPTGTYKLSYYLLGRTGGPERMNTVLTYAQSGDHYTAPNHGGFPNTMKTARVLEYDIDAPSSDFVAGKKAKLSISWGAGNFNQVGADIITGPGFGERYFTPGSSDSGRIPRLKISFDTNENTNPLYFKGGGITMRGTHRPTNAEMLTYEFVLAAENSGEDMSQQGLTAEARYNQMLYWQDEELVLTLKDVYRNDVSERCQIVNIGRMEVSSDTFNRPQYTAEVTFMVLEYT